MIENEPQNFKLGKPAVKHAVGSEPKSEPASKLPSERALDSSVIQRQSVLNNKYELLSGFLDGELTQQEAQKVALLLESEPDYKQLHDEMTAMRHEVQSLSLQESELEHLDKLFQESAAKTTRLFGFALVAVSSVILVAFIMYSVFINAAISLILKLSIGMLSIGSLLLLFSVLRQYSRYFSKSIR